MATSLSEERLADLALDSAIEAEERIHQQKTKGCALQALKEALRDVTGLDRNDGLRAYLSPGEVNVLSRALHEYAGQDARPTTDLISDLRLVLNALDQSRKTHDVEKLRKIVAFCAALSDQLSLRVQAISDARKQTDPYRR